MVEVNNLTKKYGDHVAVSGITFSLSPGRIYGLLGPNGAGKSTTMNMMTGYIAPSGGTVSVFGSDIYKDAKKAKRQIGYLPENPPVYPDMTVHEYLYFVAELKGIKKSERMLRVEEVMEETGVTDVCDRLIRALSKGYRQRVGFAGAMINEPEVLILDEPTVGLDPKQIIEFRELIKAYGSEHIVLISSHILSEISEVCDHVFIINKGKLVVDDEVENLSDYVDDETRMTISIKGDGVVAAEALRALEGVTLVEASQPDADGKLELSLGIASNVDLTEEISLALMEQRIPILGMEKKAGSLEEIFLEITDKEEEISEEADKEEEISGEADREEEISGEADIEGVLDEENTDMTGEDTETFDEGSDASDDPEISPTDKDEADEEEA